VPDLDVYDWVSGKADAPANAPYSALLKQIIDNKVYE
jgi:hypothetical protein